MSVLLRDKNGRRAAMLMIFEADNRAAAEALVQNSPYEECRAVRDTTTCTNTATSRLNLVDALQGRNLTRPAPERV